MFEGLKGLNVIDPKFIIPIIIGLVILFIIYKIAKKLVKLALFIGVLALAVMIYFNMPFFKVEDQIAVLRIKGQEYKVDIKDIKITTENQNGRIKVYLVSGSTRIELPFSKDYAEKLILNKLNKQ